MPKAYVEFTATRTEELKFADTIEVPPEVIDSGDVHGWLEEQIDVDGVVKSRFETFLDQADREDETFTLTEANTDLP